MPEPLRGYYIFWASPTLMYIYICHTHIVNTTISALHLRYRLRGHEPGDLSLVSQDLLIVIVRRPLKYYLVLPQFYQILYISSSLRPRLSFPNRRAISHIRSKHGCLRDLPHFIPQFLLRSHFLRFIKRGNLNFRRAFEPYFEHILRRRLSVLAYIKKFYHCIRSVKFVCIVVRHGCLGRETFHGNKTN